MLRFDQRDREIAEDPALAIRKRLKLFDRNVRTTGNIRYRTGPDQECRRTIGNATRIHGVIDVRMHWHDGCEPVHSELVHDVVDRPDVRTKRAECRQLEGTGAREVPVDEYLGQAVVEKEARHAQPCHRNPAVGVR